MLKAGWLLLPSGLARLFLAPPFPIGYAFASLAACSCLNSLGANPAPGALYLTASWLGEYALGPGVLLLFFKSMLERRRDLDMLKLGLL